MIPPRASTSRTTVPLAMPPIAGLQDICPMVSSALVIRPTRAPARAAATAASVPAWPAPTTTTSKLASTWPARVSCMRSKLRLRAADCESGSDAGARIFNRPRPNGGDPVALPISSGAPTLFIRRQAYESSDLSRAEIDDRLGLTADEFRVEGDCIAIGPIHGEQGDALIQLVGDLESRGLAY